MTSHTVGTREEWRTARVKLLEAEKELTRRSDELAQQRQALPWVRIDKEYVFDTEDGTASLADLFRGRSQLLVHHFMFDPTWDQGCPSCSSVADGYDGFRVHLEHHDVAMSTILRAPIEKLLAYRARMDGETDDPLEAGETHGVSAFAMPDGEVFHTYSTYARGADVLWGMHQWFDRARLGRNEHGPWWKRHDTYDEPEEE
jgi:predicted dithiol-disulfide oxidoreductase (DUF899 family)